MIDIPGVGKATIEKLNKSGIFDSQDLLSYFPKKYDYHKIDNLEQIELDKTLSLEVIITKKPRLFFIRRKLTKLMIAVKLESMNFNVVIFNREYLAKVLIKDQQIVVTGKFLKNFSNFSASNLVLKSNFIEGIIPLYGIESISDKNLQKFIKYLLEQNVEVEERIPNFIRQRHGFIDVNQMIKYIHNPRNLGEVKLAKNRMAYEELLLFALRVEAIKKINQRVLTPVKKYDIDSVKRFIQSLKFELTDDQKQATNDIFRDFKQKNQMNRLLQGDVGSGKTIVSIISSYAIVTSGYQVSILAPTLVLAKQHYQTFMNFLESFNVKIALITSEIRASDKRSIISKIENHQIDIVIGTHSLLNDDIKFKNLGFVVIDEQQRFGVQQRKKIREKGIYPDLLMMSATPIPRTLAISLFESTDVSQIKEKPKNRKNIQTKIIDFESLETVFTKIDVQLDKQRQIFVICPLIMNSDNRTYLSVEEALSIFGKRFVKSSISVLHGKMSDEEKTKVIQDFYENNINILISTTVVEVGVNVSNATTMVIFNANAFGLAQLHQLRGRIGRNDLLGYCYLVVDDILEDSERLKILETTNDGFLISEYDLSIRGPGEVFGYIQSGAPNFQVANFITDSDLRDKAFVDALDILESNDFLAKKLYLQTLKTIESYNLD
jgi:ATP-dependent DNA helicase RecG